MPHANAHGQAAGDKKILFLGLHYSMTPAAGGLVHKPQVSIPHTKGKREPSCHMHDLGIAACLHSLGIATNVHSLGIATYMQSLGRHRHTHSLGSCAA